MTADLDRDLRPKLRPPRHRTARPEFYRPASGLLSMALRWKGATVFAYFRRLGNLAIEAECSDVEFDRRGTFWLCLRPVRGSGAWWHKCEDAEVCVASKGDNTENALPLHVWSPKPIEAQGHAGGPPAKYSKHIVLPDTGEPGP